MVMPRSTRPTYFARREELADGGVGRLSLRVPSYERHGEAAPRELIGIRSRIARHTGKCTTSTSSGVTDCCVVRTVVLMDLLRLH